jgi:hypothetical protein
VHSCGTRPAPFQREKHLGEDYKEVFMLEKAVLQYGIVLVAFGIWIWKVCTIADAIPELYGVSTLVLAVPAAQAAKAFVESRTGKTTS